jgi:hypothetical protein
MSRATPPCFRASVVIFFYFGPGQSTALSTFVPSRQKLGTGRFALFLCRTFSELPALPYNSRE